MATERIWLDTTGEDDRRASFDITSKIMALTLQDASGSGRHFLRVGFFKYRKAQGSRLHPNRVGHERSEGVWPLHTALSRPKTDGGAYPDTW